MFELYTQNGRTCISYHDDQVLPPIVLVDIPAVSKPVFDLLSDLCGGANNYDRVTNPEGAISVRTLEQYGFQRLVPEAVSTECAYYFLENDSCSLNIVCKSDYSWTIYGSNGGQNVLIPLVVEADLHAAMLILGQPCKSDVDKELTDEPDA